MITLETIESLLSNKISVGKIVNSHGIRGEVKFLPFTNIEEMVKNLNEVFLYNPVTKKYLYSKVLNIKNLNRFFVLSLRGVKGVDEAKKMIGFQIFVEKDELPRLEEDEYYWYEILDAEVYYEDGEYAGKVVEVIQTGANDVISIEKNDGYKKEETLIPMTDYYIIEINKKEKIIKVRKIEWYENESEEED